MTLTDSWNGHVHEVRVLFLALVILESFKKLEECFLGNLATATLQIGKPGEPEIGVQVMGCRVERAPDGKSIRIRTELELGSLGVLQFGRRFGSLMVLLKE